MADNKLVFDLKNPHMPNCRCHPCRVLNRLERASDKANEIWWMAAKRASK